MPSAIDLEGQVFGRLTVISFSHSNNRGRHWLCRCICGNAVITRSSWLRSGETKSCGCLSIENLALGRVSRDVVSQKFGSLTALERLRRQGHDTLWLFQCDCGQTKQLRLSSVTSGHIKSCGCSKIIDLTGRRFFRLVVNSLSHIKNGLAYWNCICDCGKSIVRLGTRLRSGQAKSCGCHRRGIIGNRRGAILTKEQRERISLSNKGRKLSPAAIRKRMKPETIARIETTGQTIRCACGCGEELPTLDNRYRQRRYVRGHGSIPSEQFFIASHTPDVEKRRAVSVSKAKKGRMSPAHARSIMRRFYPGWEVDLEREEARDDD